MIKIEKSATAGIKPGTPQWLGMDAMDLGASTIEHCVDVNQCLKFFCAKLQENGEAHDADKITDLESFHKDFGAWWSRHPAKNRHHITSEGGCPPDVNLIDVLEHIADCVSAGVARSGKDKLYKPSVTPELLKRAFDNTIQLLIDNVEEA